MRIKEFKELKVDEVITKAKKKPKDIRIVKSFRLKPEAIKALKTLSQNHNVCERFIVEQMLIAAGKSIKSSDIKDTEDKVS